jgi:surface polysaccharide O-acyltransferase-like enzyme
VKDDPVAIITSVVLYIGLGLYMVSSSMSIFDLAKRKFDYTNRLLSILDRCSYGIYAVHLLFAMVLTPAYIEILKSTGVIENEFVFDAQGLSPSCLGDNDLFIWLGFLFVFVFSYVASLLLVLCLLKLPGVRYIL